jgi:TolB-like protein
VIVNHTRVFKQFTVYRLSMIKQAILACGLLLVSSLAVEAASTDTIVTMPFENLSGRTEYNWVGESFAAALADLFDKPGLVAIRPDERNVAYKQEGLPPTAILTRATMIKIAERAGASLVVMGTYRIAGEGRESTIAITGRVVDIRKGGLSERSTTAAVRWLTCRSCRVISPMRFSISTTRRCRFRETRSLLMLRSLPSARLRTS